MEMGIYTVDYIFQHTLSPRNHNFVRKYFSIDHTEK